MAAIIGFSTRLQKESVEDAYEYIRQSLISVIKKDFGIISDERSLIESAKELKNYNVLIVVALTGGTKKLIVSIGRLGKPMVLISNDKQNALSSSLHALYILRGENRNILHIFGDIKLVPWDSIGRVILGLNELLSHPMRKIVLVGVSEGFLKEEKYDLKTLKDKFKLSVKTVPLRDFLRQVTKIKPDESAILKLSEMSKEFEDANTCDRIAKIYAAVKQLMKESIAGGIRCFPIISEIGVTPCFVVSDMLDEGKILGCEADLAATISMLLAKYITKEIPFVANPITIEKTNRLILAHCTAATKLFSSDALLSRHFETGKGYAVEGSFKENSIVTLLKINPEFSKLLLVRGRILTGRRFSDEFCRNQIVVEIDKEPRELFLGEFAHHVIVVYGDYTTELRYAAKLLGLDLVDYSGL